MISVIRTTKQSNTRGEERSGKHLLGRWQLSSGSLDGNVYAKIWGPTIQAEGTVRTMTLRQARRRVWMRRYGPWGLVTKGDRSHFIQDILSQNKELGVYLPKCSSKSWADSSLGSGKIYFIFERPLKILRQCKLNSFTSFCHHCHHLEVLLILLKTYGNVGKKHRVIM